MIYFRIKWHLTSRFRIRPQGRGFYYGGTCRAAQERRMFDVQILEAFTSKEEIVTLEVDLYETWLLRGLPIL